MKINCPYCKSDQMQAVPIAYQTGVTIGRSHSSTTGVALTMGSITPTVFDASTETKTHKETLFAGNLTPPQRKQHKPVGCLQQLVSVSAGIFCILGFFLMTESRIPEYGFVMFVPSLIYGICRWRINRDEDTRIRFYNEKVFPKEIAAWNESWICHRCGYIGSLKEIISSPSAPPRL